MDESQMKTALILEDTPEGLRSKLVWQSSGHQDNPGEAISMNVMTNLVMFIKDMEERGLLRIVRESGDKPSSMHQPI